MDGELSLILVHSAKREEALCLFVRNFHYLLQDVSVVSAPLLFSCGNKKNSGEASYPSLRKGREESRRWWEERGVFGGRWWLRSSLSSQETEKTKNKKKGEEFMLRHTFQNNGLVTLVMISI